MRPWSWIELNLALYFQAWNFVCSWDWVGLSPFFEPSQVGRGWARLVTPLLTTWNDFSQYPNNRLNIVANMNLLVPDPVPKWKLVCNSPYLLDCPSFCRPSFEQSCSWTWKSVTQLAYNGWQARTLCPAIQPLNRGLEKFIAPLRDDLSPQEEVPPRRKRAHGSWCWDQDHYPNDCGIST